MGKLTNNSSRGEKVDNSLKPFKKESGNLQYNVREGSGGTMRSASTYSSPLHETFDQQRHQSINLEPYVPAKAIKIKK